MSAQTIHTILAQFRDDDLHNRLRMEDLDQNYVSTLKRSL